MCANPPLSCVVGHSPPQKRRGPPSDHRRGLLAPCAGKPTIAFGLPRAHPHVARETLSRVTAGPPVSGCFRCERWPAPSAQVFIGAGLCHQALWRGDVECLGDELAARAAAPPPTALKALETRRHLASRASSPRAAPSAERCTSEFLRCASSLRPDASDALPCA